MLSFICSFICFSLCPGSTVFLFISGFDYFSAYARAYLFFSIYLA